MQISSHDVVLRACGQGNKPRRHFSFVPIDTIAALDLRIDEIAGVTGLSMLTNQQSPIGVGSSEPDI